MWWSNWTTHRKHRQQTDIQSCTLTTYELQSCMYFVIKVTAGHGIMAEVKLCATDYWPNSGCFIMSSKCVWMAELCLNCFEIHATLHYHNFLPLPHITVYLNSSRRLRLQTTSMCVPQFPACCLQALFRSNSWWTFANLLSDQKHLFLQWPSLNAASLPDFLCLCGEMEACLHIKSSFLFVKWTLAPPVLFVP